MEYEIEVSDELYAQLETEASISIHDFIHQVIQWKLNGEEVKNMAKYEVKVPEPIENWFEENDFLDPDQIIFDFCTSVIEQAEKDPQKRNVLLDCARFSQKGGWFC